MKLLDGFESSITRFNELTEEYNLAEKYVAVELSDQEK
jgi:hypothetical protein